MILCGYGAPTRHIFEQNLLLLVHRASGWQFRPPPLPCRFFLVIRPSRWEGLNHFRVTWVGYLASDVERDILPVPLPFLLPLHTHTTTNWRCSRFYSLPLSFSLYFIDRCSLGTPQPFNGWPSNSCHIMLVAGSFLPGSAPGCRTGNGGKISNTWFHGLNCFCLGAA